MLDILEFIVLVSITPVFVVGCLSEITFSENSSVCAEDMPYSIWWIIFTAIIIAVTIFIRQPSNNVQAALKYIRNILLLPALVAWIPILLYYTGYEPSPSFWLAARSCLIFYGLIISIWSFLKLLRSMQYKHPGTDILGQRRAPSKYAHYLDKILAEDTRTARRLRRLSGYEHWKLRRQYMKRARQAAREAATLAAQTEAIQADDVLGQTLYEHDLARYRKGRRR
jgi:hypothetical protein